ncbi:VOC family protein [Frankia sp. AgKG'84/4]|uniref:VOC family protein n=1 Tax=Frankia sp. AgKG'84/4 TaxID=573490 RepID=UPI002010B4FA|nr:VOC family protein [Frankia sp. AgKG'84/4]MCL9797980.1 VOC family protein [Frankia sp. AgKG'84/4]
MSDITPIPAEHPQLSPYLCVDDADAAIAFYIDVLGATETVRMAQPDGKIGHAELTIGDSLLMLSDEYPDLGMVGPHSVGGTAVTLHLYVEDVDATFDRAVAAGAKPLRPVSDQFYGDRSGQFLDPFGHRWGVASRVENVSAEEMTRRMAALGGE